MKIFLQIVIASLLMLWLSISSLDLIGRLFIKDTVELYGGGIVDSNVQLEEAAVSWMERRLSFRNICFPAAETPSLFCAESVLVQFSPEFAPDLKNVSFSPDLWVIDAIQMKDIVIFYDIDSEGGGLHNLGIRLSNLSSDAMRDRLNAKAKDTSAPLLMVVKSLQVSGIKVDARSRKNPRRSKVFLIGDMTFTDAGLQEAGITSIEILDRVTRGIVDGIETEAEKQGLIETKSQAVDGRVSRKRSAAREESEEAEGSSGKSSPGKSLRSIGTGIKKTSQEIWRDTKELFH